VVSVALRLTVLCFTGSAGGFGRKVARSYRRKSLSTLPGAAMLSDFMHETGQFMRSSVGRLLDVVFSARCGRAFAWK
jgi:hypothetical protein